MKKYRTVSGGADRLKTLEFAILNTLTEFTGKKLNADLVLEIKEKLFKELTVGPTSWIINESPAIKKQPAPKQSGYIVVHDEVAEDILRRKELGKQKYGTELQPFNGRNPLIDAYQEVLDLAVYLRQAIYEEEMRWQRKELLYLLLEIVRMNCEIEKGKLDSMGNSSYADAIEVLIDENLLEFVEEISPDRVIAKVKDE